MPETAQRLGIILITLLFVGTTIGATIYAIYANNQDNNAQTLSQEEIEKLTQQAKEELVNPITCNNDPALNYTAQPPLAGKPLPNYVPRAEILELSCTDIVIGSGAEVTPGATITANYTGAVASTGIVFQSSLDQGQPIAFSLSQVIAGWSQGVPGMKEGGKRRIYIPSSLAYGANPPQNSGIPADANLVFDVEVVKIGQ